MMKKLSLLILLATSMWVTAQQKEVQKNTVSVTGNSLVQRVTTGYRAKIILSLDEVYYSDPTCKTLDDLKNKYYKELEANGFNSKKLKEDRMNYLSYGYQREGTVLEFMTTSKDEFLKFANVKMTGVTI